MANEFNIKDSLVEKSKNYYEQAKFYMKGITFIEYRLYVKILAEGVI